MCVSLKAVPNNHVVGVSAQSGRVVPDCTRTRLGTTLKWEEGKKGRIPAGGFEVAFRSVLWSNDSIKRLTTVLPVLAYCPGGFSGGL